MTVEYRLALTYGPERQTTVEADEDEALQTLNIPYPPALGGSTETPTGRRKVGRSAPSGLIPAGTGFHSSVVPRI